MSSTPTRFFEYKDDKSSKFWEITQVGSTVTVRYGKAGTNGQKQEKVLSDTAAVTKHVEKLVSEKTGKGYVEVADPSSSSPSPSRLSDGDAENISSNEATKGGSLKSVAQAFTPFESSNGAKKAGEFIHYKEITDFVTSVGHLTRASYDYVLEVGDTVDIPQPVFGCSFGVGTVVEILEHDKLTKEILDRNESFCAFNEEDEQILNKHFNLWGREWERVLSTTDSRTCIIQIHEPCTITASVVKGLVKRFPDGDFSRLANDDGDTHEFHFDGIDVKLVRTGKKKYDADIRVKSLLDGDCLRDRIEIEKFKQSILDSGEVENLAWSDNIIPKETLDALNGQIDIMCAAESEDFHPGSGTVVRDLVHPSLYCFVAGVSNTSISPLSNYSPELVVKQREEYTDFWGRIYEDSDYQWLPAEFMVDDQGKASIKSYINNLDESKYPKIYELIAEIFGRFVPMFESICASLKNNFNDYNGSADLKNIPLRNRKLQVVTKLVEYRVNKEEEFEGVWHVEGMSHENVLATGLCIVKRDANFEGADISFKRYLFAEEATDLICSTVQNAARPTEQMDGGDVRPLGTVKTPAGRAMVWPNSHIHKVSKMDSSDGTDATRRILVFWLVNPDTPIVSTANVQKQQGRMTLAQAKKNRLALMKERTQKKDRYNSREVFLCEH
jgi:predicted DNA-binding WGR domain protein